MHHTYTLEDKLLRPLASAYISDGSLSLLSGEDGIDQLDAAAQGHQVTAILNSLGDKTEH